MINPGRAIPPTITMLTGITQSMVFTAPRADQVLPTLLEFCGDSVIVGHNVRFDLGFINNALVRSGRKRLPNASLDTVALARRLLIDEVANCRLGTLAERYRFEHQPSHRALDDALATVDLLHLLIERAAAFGVLGLDDLHVLPKLAGHPQAAKLKMTNHLPRRPGVYLFLDRFGEVLYVGKATNLRQRVRSYFGHDDRRKIGPMLREAHSVRFFETPDPLSAAVLELRHLQLLRPRYNKQGTTWDRYAYIRVSGDLQHPRCTVVKDANASSFHLGPLPSRAMARLVIEAIDAAALVHGGFTRAALLHGLQSDPAVLVGPLRERMLTLATGRRFEAAAAIRDRAQALTAAIHRQRLIDEVRRAGQVRVSHGTTEFLFDQGRLLETSAAGQFPSPLALPAAAVSDPTLPMPREYVDEALCIARFLRQHHSQLTLQSCDGLWTQPCSTLDSFVPRQQAA
jgi:DNA polymerase III subunit epsilon